MWWRDIYILPSKAALGLLVVLALLFVLASNFQNALVYAVCFWLLAMLLLNILHTWRNLAGLRVTALGIAPCFAGERAVMELEVVRPTSSPKFALELDWDGQDQVLLDLYSTAVQRVRLACPTQQRGWFEPPRLTVRTRFPTGLAVAWADVPLPVRGVVYPAAPAAQSVRPVTQASSVHSSGQAMQHGSHDFGGVRAYQPGDAPKHIHWKQFAHTGTLYTKQFVDYRSEDLWLAWEEVPLPDREARLSHLCRRVLECHQEQQRFGLRLPGVIIAPDQGEAHKARCLQALALFGVADGA